MWPRIVAFVSLAAIGLAVLVGAEGEDFVPVLRCLTGAVADESPDS